MTLKVGCYTCGWQGEKDNLVQRDRLFSRRFRWHCPVCGHVTGGGRYLSKRLSKKLTAALLRP